MKAPTYIFMLLVALLLTVVNCTQKADATLQQRAIRVMVQEIMTLDGSKTLAYSGTIEESETIPLSFSLLGTVARVYVNDGDLVNKGRLLAEMDDATYRNAYQMTKAAEERALDAYQRLTPMHQNGNLPEIKYVEVETGLRQAQAAAAIAKKNLDDCKLYAPTAGYIGKRSIDPGATATPAIPAITIVKINKVYARISVAENEIARVKKGDPAVIKIGALGNQAFSGVVEQVGITADPLVHTYKIKISVANDHQAIKPGMVCSAIMRHANQTAMVAAPNHSVLVDERGNNYVYRVDAGQNRAVRVPVKTGKLLRDGVEILEGLQAGDLVVTAGQQKLVDQSAVSIIGR